MRRQSTEPTWSAPRHTAIIMDGNGRWAQARGIPRSFGHRRGAKAVERVVRAAPDLGIEVLTLYAFSSDNWQRPRREVRSLMKLLEDFLRQETERCVEHGVRLTVIGRRDRLKPSIVEAIEAAEATTVGGDRLHLRLAVDYSSRASIASAAGSPLLDSSDPECFALRLNQAIHSALPAPDVDLVIRTGGEKRLSDFLLWESAYAELLFIDTLWPDFGAEDLRNAVADFSQRQRRFGAVLSPDQAAQQADLPVGAALDDDRRAVGS